MRNLVLETRICDLQEYLELAGFTNAKMALEEVGFVAQEYAYTVATTKNDDYFARCAQPVIGGNYDEAVERTVKILVEDYRNYINKN